MRVRKYSGVVEICLGMLLLTSCLLPGMIPLDSDSETAMPVMEENTDSVIEVLQSDNWRALQTLAKERYTEKDFAQPGTLTYTVNVAPEDLPVYFSYGWCATDEATLTQNFEHMRVGLAINGKMLAEDVVHNLSFTSQDNMLCVDFGVLITEWAPGNYTLEAVATFEEKINDGRSDFDPGDYAFIYNVAVSE